MKKLLTLTLVLLMALSSVAMASDNAHLVNTDPNSIAIATELVELDVLARKNPAQFDLAEKWFVKFCEKELNVKLNIEAVDASVFAEKLNIIMSTDSMPDMIHAAATFWADVTLAYGMRDGLLLPIDEYKEYAPNYWTEIAKQPDLVKFTTLPDGHTYGFSSIMMPVEGQSLGIFTATNQGWLDNLGLEMPTTLDAFYDMLVAFRDNDANGDGDATNEVPWQGAWNGGYPERLPIFWAYGYNGYRWDEVDSTTFEGYFAPYVPEYKEIIGFMKQCWDEGLMQETMFSGTGEENKAYGQANTDYTYYGYSVDLHPTELTGNPDYYTDFIAQIPLVVDDTVTRTTWKGLSFDMGTWNINAETEYPEVCVAFLDFWYDPYWSICYVNGPEYGTEYDYDGVGWTWNAETLSIERNHIPADYTGTDFVGDYLTVNDGYGFGLYTDTALRYNYPEYAASYGSNWSEFDRHWQASLSANNTPYEMVEYADYIFFTEEDQEFFNMYKSPLQNYMMAQEAMFIAGERDWSEFEDYMSELDDMGGQEFNQFVKEKIAELFAE